QTTARLGRLAGRAKRPPARDVLEHDPAAALREPLAEQPQRRLHPLGVVVRRARQVVRRQRLRRHHRQRLDRPREPVDRARGDQAERAIPVHSTLLSSSARRTRIGANGAACSSETSSVRRSSSSARNATACSTRDIPATSASRSNTLRRRNTERKRSRNRDTGGKRSSRCASETAGGSAASARNTAARRSGSCGASLRCSRGANGAGPSRKKRSLSSSSRSVNHTAASFARRYSASRRASSSAASSGSSSDSSASSWEKSPRAFSSKSAA